MSEETTQETAPAERDWTAEATGMGWNAEYEGPDKLEPREFVLRKPLYDEMKKLRKKTKELETAIRTQTQMQEQLVQKERQDVMNQLKAEKIRAIEESDAARVVEIDDQMEKIRSTPVQKPNGPPPEFVEWSSKPENNWYSDNEDMQAWADAYGLRQYQKNPNRPIAEIYEEVSRKVKDVFPHKFSNPKRERAGTVDSSETKKTGGKDEIGEHSIPKEYKSIFHTMWRAGAWGDITMKDAAKKYAMDLEKVGALGGE